MMKKKREAKLFLPTSASLDNHPLIKSKPVKREVLPRELTLDFPQGTFKRTQEKNLKVTSC